MILRTNATLAAKITMTAVTTAARTLATLAAIIITDREDKVSGISDSPDIPD